LTDPLNVVSFLGPITSKRLQEEKMTRKILVASIAILLTGVAVAARDSKNVKLTGYIIDNACAAGRATGDNAADKVKNHTVKCAQMAKCAESGYALYADGKLYKLDEDGNKKAGELLKNTKVERGMQVTIEGTLDGETLKVSKIAEVAS